MVSNIRIVFMGTPDFAQESLKSLCEAKYNVVGVVTNIDKPQGRGMKKVFTPVKEYAISRNIPVYQPEKVRKNEEFLEQLKTLKPDLICVVAYGKILPKEILEIPPLGCINVHASLLPKYRGAAPIQWAILNGEKETGITTMYMDIGMDTGDMILKEKITISEEETTGELWDRLSLLGGKLLVKTIQEIEKGTAPREKQTEDFTIAPMLNKEMAKIDWNEKTAENLKDLVRGLNPIMGAYSNIEGKKIKFWKVKSLSENEFQEQQPLYENLPKEPGTILISSDKQGLFIQTKQGILQVLEIQGENAKKMLVADFLRGTPLKPGNKFE